jgi:hypothetical protein
MYNKPLNQWLTLIGVFAEGPVSPGLTPVSAPPTGGEIERNFIERNCESQQVVFKNQA